ncbi:MAG TPA: SRPBCC family protein [Saprospiraceae bacterium]|nr:SRPBCC domain-containing protein [Lewinellaceae bacterium]HRV86328.1 SRPBCC family protein [Saprospiraceae bacterium]
MTSKTQISIDTSVLVPVAKAWECYTVVDHVLQWNHASDDWHSPSGENDLRPGGKFNYRMEAKDGSFGFDFWGIYDEVVPEEKIAYTLGDGRKAIVSFTPAGDHTDISVLFEAEDTNPVEMQRGGWQMILNNYKKYTESCK